MPTRIDIAAWDADPVLDAPTIPEPPGNPGRRSGLVVRDLTTQFATASGRVTAVDGIGFRVAPGERVGIVGESGSGKSVAVRSILGLVNSPGRVVGGEIYFDGDDLRTDRRALRRHRGVGLGFIPQNPWGAINPVLSIADQFRNVIRRRDPRATRAAIATGSVEMLARVGIGDPERVLAGYVHQVSGGMAQRIVIALTLSLRPSLVIADEPTTGLDVITSRTVLDLIATLLDEDGRAMLMVTHDLGVVAQYCDRVVVMRRGRVVETGTVMDVFTDPQHPYTAALLSSVPTPGRRLPDAIGSLDVFEATTTPVGPR